MTIAYQFTSKGYFTKEIEDYGLLPNNATYIRPERKEGFIPCFNDSTWDQVENHVGKAGYLNGERYTIKGYGPLPEGWSLTPDELTGEELYTKEKESITLKYSAPWDGSTSGTIIAIQMAMSAALCEETQDDAKIQDLKVQYTHEIAAMKEELDTLNAKYNIETE